MITYIAKISTIARVTMEREEVRYLRYVCHVLTSEPLELPWHQLGRGGIESMRTFTMMMKTLPIIIIIIHVVMLDIAIMDTDGTYGMMVIGSGDRMRRK